MGIHIKRLNVNLYVFSYIYCYGRVSPCTRRIVPEIISQYLANLGAPRVTTAKFVRLAKLAGGQGAHFSSLRQFPLRLYFFLATGGVICLTPRYQTYSALQPHMTHQKSCPACPNSCTFEELILVKKRTVLLRPTTKLRPFQGAETCQIWYSFARLTERLIESTRWLTVHDSFKFKLTFQPDFRDFTQGFFARLVVRFKLPVVQFI